MTKLWTISMKIGDPMWIMPLWEPMRSSIKASAVADLVNAAEGFVISFFTSSPFPTLNC